MDKIFKAAFDNVRWVVFSDHGMSDVQDRVDGGATVLEAAHKYKLQHGVDFLMFLDSTMIRLWHLNDQAKEFVASILHELPVLRDKGVVIDDSIAKRYRIPAHYSPCGDAIWWAHPGVIVCPDYFWPSQHPPKGMHGYIPDDEDAKGFAVVAGKQIPHATIEQVNLVDICPTLCDVVGIRYPKHNEGESMVAEISDHLHNKCGT